MAKFGLTTKRTKVTKNSRKDCLSFVLFVVKTIPAFFVAADRSAFFLYE